MHEQLMTYAHRQRLAPLAAMRFCYNRAEFALKHTAMSFSQTANTLITCTCQCVHSCPCFTGVSKRGEQAQSIKHFLYVYRSVIESRIARLLGQIARKCKW